MSDYEILSFEEYFRSVANNYVKTRTERESLKGPPARIFPHPVEQEIPYEALFDNSYSLEKPIPPPVPYTPPEPVRHYQTWPHRADIYLLENQEDILKGLGPVQHPLLFEIFGDHSSISFHLHCQKTELPLINSAMQSRLPQIELVEASDRMSLFFGNRIAHLKDNLSNLKFLMAFPPRGMTYADYLNTQQTFNGNIYGLLLQLMSELEEGEFLSANVMLTPCKRGHLWGRNIEQIRIDDFRRKLNSSVIPAASSTFGSQTPDSYLPHAAEETMKKADRDQGFLAVSMYLTGVFREERSERFFRGMEAFFGQFRLGGKALKYATQDDLLKTFGNLEKSVHALCSRIPYWQGWIMPTSEAVTFTQIPLKEEFLKNERLRIDYQKNSKLLPEFTRGQHILGYTDVFGKEAPIYLPEDVSNRHSLVLGDSGSGKSTTLLFRALQWIQEENTSLFCFDPHGRLPRTLLENLPEEMLDKVVVFSISDYPNVPLYYPSRAKPGEDISKVAWDIASAFMQAFPGQGTPRPRMENAYANLSLATLVWPEMTWSKIGLNLLAKKGKTAQLALKNRTLLVEKLERLGLTESARFWQVEFAEYKLADVSSTTNKFGKVFGNRILNRMFDLGPDRSGIDLEAMCESPHIFLCLVDRGSVGDEVSYVVNALLLAELKRILFRRMNRPVKNRVELILEESAFFDPGLIETILTEGRKALFNLHLAYPKIPSLYEQGTLISSLKSVGVKHVFSMDPREAKKIFGGVGAEQNDLKDADIRQLQRGEAFLNLKGRTIEVRIPMPAPGKNNTEMFMAESRRKYYAQIGDAEPVDLIPPDMKKTEAPSVVKKTPRKPKRFDQ